MNIHDINLPPEFQSGNSVPVSQSTIKRERMIEILRFAIAPYQQRIAELESQLEAIGAGGVDGRRLIGDSCHQRIEELEAELQELQRQWVEHDTLGCPTAKTGIYASKADRKTYNSIGEGTIQQLHDVLLYLQNETMKLEAAYGSNFKKEATEKARATTEKMKEAVYAIKNIDRKRRGEPVAWLYEDELPDNYPYDTMFPYSKVDGVRMFPVDDPQPAEPVDTDLVQRWQREHGVVLTPGTREAAMVVIRHDEDGKPTVWCDPEIADLVRALNDGGLATVASCSGHGHRPGNIMLADGRVLIVCKDADEAREVESHFPGVNGEVPLAADPVKVPSEDERAAQGLPPYSPRHMTEEEWNRLTESGRRAWGKQPAVPEKEPPCET